jgi:hypothetical protein
MPQFQFANVPGSVQQGRQFAAQNAQNQENLAQSQFKGGQAKELDALRKNIRSAMNLQAVPNAQKPEFLANAIATGEAEGRDMTQSKQALELVNTGRFDELEQGTNKLLEVATRMGDIQRPTDGITAGQREFQSLLDMAGDDSNQEQQRAAQIKLRMIPGAVGSSAQTVAQSPDLTQQVAESGAIIEGAKSAAKESGKLEQQLIHQPVITRAIKLAEAKATEQGAVLTDLARAEAGMPGLIEATNNLKELATIATSTMAGSVYDFAAKESGWGSTEGATAKARYTAIIDNQVLPLLKQVFGGAMTEGEGLRLTKTLGDPDAAPEVKIAQTEAFMEHQMRQYKTLQRQAEEGAEKGEATPKVLNFDAQGNLI